MDCDEVLAALRERGEAGRIAGLLALCEQEPARVATAREVVGELPVSQGAARTRVPAPRAGTAGPGAGETAGRAGEFVDRVLNVLAGCPGPVRCRQVVEALGLEAVPREVERVRHQLRRAAAGGLVTQTPGGLFTLTRAPAAARG